MATPKLLLDYKQLSSLSKEYLAYITPFNRRLLLLQTSQTNCIPFRGLLRKREDYITELKNMKKQLELTLISEFNLKKQTSSFDEAARYQQLAQEAIDDETRDFYVNLAKSYKEFGESGGDNKIVMEFDAQDPRYIEVNRKLKEAESLLLLPSQTSKTDLNLESDQQIKSQLAALPPQCQCCGITLPEKYFEFHIDFVTGEKHKVCPLCHYVEHIDEAASYNVGYVTHLPNLTQEQVNLISYAYFLMRTINDIVNGDFKDATLSEKDVNQLRRIFATPLIPKNNDENSKQSQLNAKYADYTFYELFANLKALRNEMKLKSNDIVKFFQAKSNLQGDELLLEYRRVFDLDDEIQLADFLDQQFQKFNSKTYDFKTERYFSFNLDNMNLPAFYASILMKYGVRQNSGKTPEEKLNILTRLDGLRLLPSYSFFKPFMLDWMKHFLTNKLIMELSLFAFENLAEFSISSDAEIEQKIESELTSQDNTSEQVPSSPQPLEQEQPNNIQSESKNTENAVIETQENNAESTDNPLDDDEELAALKQAQEMSGSNFEPDDEIGIGSDYPDEKHQEEDEDPEFEDEQY